MGVASLILGIFGIIPYVGWIISPIVSLIAWILGDIKIGKIRRSPDKKGMGVAVAGKIMGIIGFLQGAAFWGFVIYMACVAHKAARYHSYYY